MTRAQSSLSVCEMGSGMKNEFTSSGFILAANSIPVTWIDLCKNI